MKSLIKYSTNHWYDEDTQDIYVGVLYVRAINYLNFTFYKYNSNKDAQTILLEEVIESPYGIFSVSDSIKLTYNSTTKVFNISFIFNSGNIFAFNIQNYRDNCFVSDVTILRSPAPTFTETPRPTEEPTPTATPTQTFTRTPSKTPSVTVTSTPVATSLITPTPTVTTTVSLTQTHTPTKTSTPTVTITSTETSTPTPTTTLTPTQTTTVSYTPTNTVTSYVTPTPTQTATTTTSLTVTPTTTQTNTSTTSITPTPSLPQANSLLGYSIGIDENGDTVIASSPGYSYTEARNNIVYKGRVAVYNTSAVKDTSEAALGINLTSSSNSSIGTTYIYPTGVRNQTSSLFGFDTAISLNGTTIVVGDPAGLSTEGIAATDVSRGYVSVFIKNALGQWIPQGRDITSNSGAIGATGNATGFGYSVSVNRDGSIVAAASLLEESVLVYAWNSTKNQWILRSRINKPYPVGDDSNKFGKSISLSGDGFRLAIGAPSYGVGEGEVHMYVWDGQDYIREDVIANPLRARFTEFGADIKFRSDGRYIAICAPEATLFDSVGKTDSGAVSYFGYDETLKKYKQYATLRGTRYAKFKKVSISSTPEHSIIIGSPTNDSTSGIQANEGRVYRYGDISGITGTAPTKSPLVLNTYKSLTPASNDKFGYSVDISDSGLYSIAASTDVRNMSRGCVFLYKNS